MIGGAKTKARAADEGGDALLDSLLGEIEQDPMGTTANNPFAKRAAVSSGAATRPAMPNYRPSGGSGGGETDLSRAPPGPSAIDIEGVAPFERQGSEALADARDGGGEAGWRSQSNGPGVDVADPGSPRDADSRVEEGPGVVPFMSAEAEATSLDWFQLCDEGGEAGAAAAAVAEQPQAYAAVCSAATGMPPLDQDGALHMFWIDAFEDATNAPGCVFLFGKVRCADGTFASCCASLNSLERNVYALPRTRALVDGREVGDEVSFVQVFNEVQQLCKRHRIQKFGCKRVDRSYAFEEAEVPHSASYLKLVYSAEYPALPNDASGTYFRRLFGTHTSALELLLRKRKVMGPCWLKLSGAKPASASNSWCKYEVLLQGRKAVQVLERPPPPPPLVVASLHLQTVLNAKHVPEVAIASVITHTSVAVDGATARPTALTSFSVVRKLEQRTWPWDLQRTVAADKRLKLEVCPSERALLNFLVAKLHGLDADVLVGHNIAAHDVAVLLQRMQAHRARLCARPHHPQPTTARRARRAHTQPSPSPRYPPPRSLPNLRENSDRPLALHPQACKIQHWSKVGRMRMKTMPKLSGGNNSAFSGGNWAEWTVVAGRLMCDTFLSSRELLPSQRSYGLKELARTQLSANKPDIEQQVSQAQQPNGKTFAQS